MILQVDNLTAGYGSLEVLHGVSLAIKQGEKVAILGPNGAGKSTLLRTLSGLVRSSSGTVLFDGRRIDQTEAYRIPRLGLVQVPEARHIFPALSVEENLLVGGTVQSNKAKRHETLSEVWEIFPALRLKAKAAAGSLSGGQQQMLAIGRALMGRPKLILLDEPSLGLAPIVVREVFDTLDRLVANGLTVLVVEQDVYLTLKFVNRAYVLENGRIALSGSSRQLMADDHVRELYLGM